MRITLLMPFALVALAGSSLRAMQPAAKGTSAPSTPVMGKAAAAVAKDKIEATVVEGLGELEAVAGTAHSSFVDAFKRTNPFLVQLIPDQHLEATLKVLANRHPHIVDAVMKKVAPAGHRGLSVSAEALDAVSKLAQSEANQATMAAAFGAFSTVVQGLTGTQAAGGVETIIQNAIKAELAALTSSDPAQPGSALQVLIQKAVAAGLAELDQVARSGCGKKAVKK